MTRLINHLLILLFVFTTTAALAAAQDKRVISAVEFEGLKAVAAAEALSTSGLKADQPFKIEDIDAAAQRLLDSGLFKQVGYRTRTAGNKITITFQVEEAGGGDSPVYFDNFIWFTEEQIIEAVRREVPLFAGRAPNAGKMPEAITRALQQLLNEKNIPGTVDYLASQSLSGRMLGHIFSVKGVKMPICTIRFPGAKNIAEEKLAGIAKELADVDYSSEVIRGFAGMKLVAAYREVGQLRAKFTAPVAKPDPRCTNGVDVTLPVEEGLIYSWGPIDWSGANALTGDQLTSVLGIKQGEVANGLQFDKGLIAVTRALGRQGYLEARLRPVPEFDDSSRKVTYKIDVHEGPQYRMGGLTFKGLPERDARALRNAWRMPRGEVFDHDYFEEFFRKDARNAMQQILEERREAGKPPPRIDRKITPNRATLTVDVTIEMSN